MQPGKQPVFSPGGNQGSKTAKTQGLGKETPSLVPLNLEPGLSGLSKALWPPQRPAGGTACPGSMQGGWAGTKNLGKPTLVVGVGWRMRSSGVP